MPIGPGKYGARAEQLLKEVGGELCLVLLLGGDKGPAFDVCCTNPALLLQLPLLLRDLADNIANEAITDLDHIVFGPKPRQ
jgi:hypothetical protein